MAIGACIPFNLLYPLLDVVIVAKVVALQCLHCSHPSRTLRQSQSRGLAFTATILAPPVMISHSTTKFLLPSPQYLLALLMKATLEPAEILRGRFLLRHNG